MLFEILAEILSVLRRNKLRTLLTTLSVSWGMLMLALLLGAGRGLENGVEWEFRDGALAAIWAYAGQTSIPYAGRGPGRDVGLVSADLEAVRRRVPEIEESSARFHLWGEYQVRYGRRHSAFQVLGVHPGYRALDLLEIRRGRFVDEADLRERRKVAVIGTRAREVLFGDADPVGQYVEIRGLDYRVVGEFEDQGGEAQLRRIYVPVTTAQLVYQSTDRIHELAFTFSASEPGANRDIAERTRSLLMARHAVAPEDRQAVHVFDTLEEYRKITQVFSWVRVIVWLVGGGTLFAGVVGVSNIMLISVAERTREFGIRKAVGATARSIAGMVVFEAALITALAGYLGLVAGVGLVELVSREVKNAPFLRDPSVNIGAALAAAGLLVVAGVLAGLLPALRAARVAPAQTLREGA